MTNNLRFKWKNTNILMENWYFRNQPAESIFKAFLCFQQKNMTQREWRKQDFNFDIIVQKNLKIVVIQYYWLVYLFQRVVICLKRTLIAIPRQYIARDSWIKTKKRKLINKGNLIKLEIKLKHNFLCIKFK